MATTVPSREAIYDVVRTLRDVMNKCLCLCQKVLISFSPGFSRVLAEQDKMVNRLTVYLLLISGHTDDAAVEVVPN
jgi:hypothetical protein